MPSYIHHGLVANLLSQFHGRDVKRVRHCLAQRYGAHIALLEVIGLVRLRTEQKGRRLVEDNAVGSEDLGAARQCRLYACRIDKRLEDRTRLPFRQHVVQLAGA